MEYFIAIYVFMVICTTLAIHDRSGLMDWIVSVVFGILWPFIIMINLLSRLLK